jgi:hypothetical protein
MKNFIFKVSLFFILLSILFLSFFLILSIIDNFKGFSKYSDVVVIGDSHAVFSINEKDSLFSDINLLNNGFQAESLFWTIKRARKIVRKKRLSLLVITYSDHNLFNDKWTYVGDNIGKNRYLTYYLSLKDWYYLFRRNSKETAKLFFSLPVPSFKVSANSQINYNNILSKELKTNGSRVKSHYQKIKNIYKSENFIQLLNFCRENPDQKILILRTPLNSHYFKLLNNKVYDEMYLESILELQKLNNVHFIDFSDSIKDDANFSDLDHLNANGSKIFTKLVYDSLVRNKFIPIK